MTEGFNHMPNYAALIAANQQRFLKAKILPARQHEVDSVARRLCDPAAKARYVEISDATREFSPNKATQVPWFIIAVIHEREASQNFHAQLSQGDPLNSVSFHKPRGRGPFHDHDGHDAFYWGALDALVHCAPFAALWPDWSVGGALTLTVLYNGIGYDLYHHEPSPYDWGGTTVQQIGKYTADGVFSIHTWDTQLGCAAMLMAMRQLDNSVVLS